MEKDTQKTVSKVVYKLGKKDMKQYLDEEIIQVFKNLFFL